LVNASDGTDVPGGTVSLMIGGGAAGQFQYTNLPSPVTLAAGAGFYVVSLESLGGDYWYHDGYTTLTTTAAATHDGAIYGWVPGQWYQSGSASNHTFGPVDFTYTTNPPPPTSNYAISANLGLLQNNFSGYVGMNIVVGASPLTVMALGRMVADGNDGTHTLKLVNASDGTDVPGGTVSLAIGGGAAGQFQYTNLASPVTLAAGARFYVVSLESLGGDYWYHDSYTTLTTTAAATHNGAIYGWVPGQWYQSGSASNHTFGPVDFTYTAP
jgi:hypothetical protein